MASDDMDIEQDVTLRMPETPVKRMVLVDADELAALRQWRDRAVPLLQALDTLPPVIYPEADHWVCILCSKTTPYDFDDLADDRVHLVHAANCPVTAARALLAESEASDAHA